jgi:hypothetical protein
MGPRSHGATRTRNGVEGMPPSTNRIPSGQYWVTWLKSYAPTSDRVEDLELSFRAKVREFIEALRNAKATVEVKHTKRTLQAAYLWHWAWKIAQRRCAPKDAKPYSKSPPIPNIQWDHGNLAKSIKGAQEMVNGFGLSVPRESTLPPSENSRHVPGRAIDMEITWIGTISVKKKDGSVVNVKYGPVNANKDLHAVGASYGVHKLLKDNVHWSDNGQ